MKGIYFDDIHSFNDLGLILSAVDIPPATPKTNYVDVPCADGSIDLTEAVGEVRFEDRECSFAFTVMPNDPIEPKKRAVNALLNGKRCKIVLDKDPDYYWEGRCRIDSYAAYKNVHEIAVKATVAPYRMKRDLTEITVSAGNNVEIALTNARKTVIPTITCTAETQITVGENTFTLSSGTYQHTGLILTEGTTVVTVTSAEDVKFSYREGDL